MTLGDEFTAFLFQLADETKTETGGKYNPMAFRGMLHSKGGVATAKQLINSKKLSEGYITLCKLERLDLTLESQVIENKKWHKLFTPKELIICRGRVEN